MMRFIELPDGKVGTVVASLAFAVGGVIGYFLARAEEEKLHRLDVVEELIGDSTAPALHPATTALYNDDEDGEDGSIVTPREGLNDSPSTPLDKKPHRSGSVSSSGISSSTPPRPIQGHRRPTGADTVGRATSGVVVHIDEARRKMSVDHAHPGPVIVGVAGGSGSGKTSIASLIAARLAGREVVSISSDNYYITLPPGTDASEYNFDHPSAIDFPLLATHLAALKQGEAVEVPMYDFVHHKRTPKTLRVCGKATDVIIVDGIFVLWSEAVRGLCDVTLFTAEDSDVCLARRLRRDIVERGRTVESVLAQYLKHVKAGFTQFVAPSMSTADFIIPRARENATAIDMLARDIQRRVADNVEAQQAQDKQQQLHAHAHAAAATASTS